MNIYENVKKGNKIFFSLKMVILMKRKNLIKATQSYEYIVSLIFKDKIQVPITLLLFWITQGSPSTTSPYFFFKKYIAFSNIRNCMLKRDMEFRPFYLFVSQFVCNLKIPLRNSVITTSNVLNIWIADCRIFWWIETEPLNKSILLSI